MATGADALRGESVVWRATFLWEEWWACVYECRPRAGKSRARMSEWLWRGRGWRTASVELVRCGVILAWQQVRTHCEANPSFGELLFCGKSGGGAGGRGGGEVARGA